MTFAILFPGQGSQEVGMGAELFDARPDLLVNAAERVLGWSLRDVCLAGPIESLTATDRAQPAIFALSYVLWDELASRISSTPAAAAGHSLGEYSALAAAGVFDFETGLRLVAARGAAMAAAAAKEPSGMAALVGAEAEGAEKICRARREDGGRLWVANVNTPGQVVVAGGEDDISWLQGAARDLGVRRAIPLQVAGAFHSPFMEPAVDTVASALDHVQFAEPAFDVWSNTTASPLDAGTVAANLAAQVVSPVRFSASLDGIAAAGSRTFIHVGPGDVTAGMVRRTVSDAVILNANRLDELDQVAADLADSIE